MKDWKNIWNNKSEGVQGGTLSELLKIDGFNSSTGTVKEENWLLMINEFKDRLKIKPGMNIFEVGCGAGAFLLPFYDENYSVAGIDYSVGHIKIAKEVMQEGLFQVAEADKIVFKENWADIVVSNGVFHYFNDLQYAKNVINKMNAIAGVNGKIAILDLPDEKKKIKYIAKRKQKLGEEKYNELYGDLHTQYYSKQWCLEIGKSINRKTTIVDQNMPNYDNKEFRFNVYYE